MRIYLSLFSFPCTPLLARPPESPGSCAPTQAKIQHTLGVLYFWLGRSDSNTRMTESEDFAKVQKQPSFSVFLYKKRPFGLFMKKFPILSPKHQNFTIRKQRSKILLCYLYFNCFFNSWKLSNALCRFSIISSASTSEGRGGCEALPTSTALYFKGIHDYAPTMPQANFSFILYIFSVF